MLKEGQAERIAVIMGKMHSGGKKNLVMEYYRNMDRDRIQLDFICDSDSNAIPRQEILALGGRVYVVAPYQHILRNMYGLYKIFKKNNYKVVHAYNGTMNVFPLFVAQGAGIPIRISESISMAHDADRKTGIKKVLRRFSRSFSTNYMANGIACGKWQFGDDLYEQGRITIFKTVIDTAKNDLDVASRNETRKRLGIGEGTMVCGHIGRLTEQKNTLFIIDIFNEVLKLDQESRLLLIGDGNLRKKMIEKIKKLKIEDNVLYLGRREDIQQFYNAMDCFLLPSLYEGLPVVGVEAETCGLPVFFSEEIPRESSVCSDLGYFISLDRPAVEWARCIVENTRKHMKNRSGRAGEAKRAGFDSHEEGEKLTDYYIGLMKRIDDR